MHQKELLCELRRVGGRDIGVVAAEGDWIEASPPGVTKATALGQVCRHLGISPRSVVAIGDHANDLPMLAWSGLSLAVANALPEVMQVVDGIIPSNRDDGVARFLEVLVDHDFKISLTELRRALSPA